MAQSPLEPAARYAAVSRVLTHVLALNLGVALAKIIFGYSSGTVSILSDGFHSLTDAASNVVGLVGVRAAGRPPDSDHPYGHRKYETVAAAGVGVFLLLVFVELLRNAFNHLTGRAPVLEISIGSFVVMIVTIAVNLFVVRYESEEGERLASEVLIADATQTRGDVNLWTSSVDCRSVWLARTTAATPRSGLAALSRADHPPVFGHQVVDRARELHLRRAARSGSRRPVPGRRAGGRRADGGAGVGHAAHQRLQELPTGQRVQAGDRLVEQQQPGRLASASASATWARCPPDSLPTGLSGGMPSCGQPGPGQPPSQRRLSLPPIVTSSAAVKSRYSGVSWATNPMSARIAVVSSYGAAPNTRTAARVGPQQPDGQVQQRALAGPVRPDQRGDPAAGRCSEQSRSAQVSPYRLPSWSVSSAMSMVFLLIA